MTRRVFFAARRVLGAGSPELLGVQGMRSVARFLLVALVTMLALAAVPAARASLSDNLDNPFLAFMTAGDDGVAWVEVNGLGRTGGDADCARSGHFPDLDQLLPYYFKVTSISTQVTGPGELSFWWKISSAPTHDARRAPGRGRRQVPRLDRAVG